MLRRRVLVVAVALGFAADVWAMHDVHPVAGWVYEAHPSRPTVVMIVLDTVRADHLSLCGYDRPTTPVLEGLERQGASVACHAYSPAPWTLPSHASYFTGLDVPSHGAAMSLEDLELPDDPTGCAALDASSAPDDDGERYLFGRCMRVVPLDDDVPTLAEQMRDRGYQTVAVSGNPVVSSYTGLTRGFDHTWAPTRFLSDPREVTSHLDGILHGDVDGDEPLFVFVNVSTAHEPWAPVPAGVPWVPERPSLWYGGADDMYARYMSGRMTPDDASQGLAHLRDVYDWGIHSADGAVGGVLDTLRDHGWLDGGYRLVVTADHGEYLGEHGRLGHALAGEPTSRVFVLDLDTTGPQIELPDEIASREVYWLARDGARPSLPVPIEQVSRPYPFAAHFSEGRQGTAFGAAAWYGSEKLVWEDGQISRYDLEADPDEDTPLPVDPEDVRVARLTKLALRNLASAYEADPEHDQGAMRLLKSLGYVR